MTKIFISHSYQDKKFVNLLTSRLRDDGIQVWTDEKELAVGDNIEEKVTDAIKKTDYFIVVLSKNSTKSKWVNFELSATIRKDKHKNQ